MARSRGLGDVYKRQVNPVLVRVHPYFFEGREDELPYWQRDDSDEFAFGDAVTCHKSQGSEWESVVVFDESESFREDAQRWLYTAVTRAAERLTVVTGRAVGAARGTFTGGGL
jgi:exodeoxyribonuclease-5